MHKTKDGDLLNIGEIEVKVIHTPGHTYDHNCYLIKDKLLSGDCLFIGDVGRIDLGGDPMKKQSYCTKSKKTREITTKHTSIS